MSVLCVILARGGSSRLPRKNLAHLGGVSLVRRAAIAASLAGTVSRTVISTDCPEIADDCSGWASWIKRPPELSGAHARIEDAARHALEQCEAQDGRRYEYVVALQAAAPVRPAGAIDALVSAVRASHARGGVTVVGRSPWIWQVGDDNRALTWWHAPHYPRSQDVDGTRYEEINCIQVSPRAEVLACRRWAAPLVLMELPGWCAVDIDTSADLESARMAWPAIEAAAGQVNDYPCRLVSVPQAARRKVNAPLETDSHAGAVGVVL